MSEDKESRKLDHVNEPVPKEIQDIILSYHEDKEEKKPHPAGYYSVNTAVILATPALFTYGCIQGKGLSPDTKTGRVVGAVFGSIGTALSIVCAIPALTISGTLDLHLHVTNKNKLIKSKEDTYKASFFVDFNRKANVVRQGLGEVINRDMIKSDLRQSK